MKQGDIMYIPHVRLARTVRALCAGLTLLAVVVTISAASAQTSPAPLLKLKVAAIPIDVSGTVYYANDLGLFKKRGLEVEILSMASGAAVAPAVSSGAVNIGSANFISLAQAHERGIPFLMIAPSGVYSNKAPTTQLVVSKTSTLKTAKDLNGKIVAVASLNNIAQITVCAWSDKNGGDYKSLKFVEVPPPQMSAALAAGRVDAAEIAEPFLSQSLATDGRILAADGDAIGNSWVEGGYFAMSDYVKKNGDTLKKFTAAIQEAGRWANKNPDAASQILIKFGRGSTTKILYHVAFPDRFKPTDAQTMIDVAAKYGALKAPFSSAEMMAPEILAQ
jgi:NitT/TauT family transport system substrate-binding protein